MTRRQVETGSNFHQDKLKGVASGRAESECWCRSAMSTSRDLLSTCLQLSSAARRRFEAPCIRQSGIGTNSPLSTLQSVLHPGCSCVYHQNTADIVLESFA